MRDVKYEPKLLAGEQIVDVLLFASMMEAKQTEACEVTVHILSSTQLMFNFTHDTNRTQRTCCQSHVLYIRTIPAVPHQLNLHKHINKQKQNVNVNSAKVWYLTPSANVAPF